MGRGSSRCGRHKCCPSRRESAAAARESSFLGNRVRGASREEGSVWAPGEAGCGSGGDGSGCGKGRGCGTAACGEPGRVRPRRRAGRRGRGERSEELQGCPAPGWGGPSALLRRGEETPRLGAAAEWWLRARRAARPFPPWESAAASAAPGAARPLRGEGSAAGRLRRQASLIAIRAPCGGKRPEKLPSGPRSGRGRAEAPALLCGSRTWRRGRGLSLAGASNCKDEGNLVRAARERSPVCCWGCAQPSLVPVAEKQF